MPIRLLCLLLPLIFSSSFVCNTFESGRCEESADRGWSSWWINTENCDAVTALDASSQFYGTTLRLCFPGVYRHKVLQDCDALLVSYKFALYGLWSD